MPAATLEQVAHVLNLSPRRVQQLVKSEGMPKSSRGEYDLVHCVHWYIAYLTKRMEDARRGSSETESQARARYMSAVADMKQMDVEERKGEVVRIETVGEELEPVIMSMRSIILSMPRRMAALLAPANIEGRINIEHIVDEYVRNILDQISTIPQRINRHSDEKRKKWAGVDIGPVKASPIGKTGNPRREGNIR